MARYTVHMTFEAPALSTPLKITHRLPGRAASMQLLGADGLLAVSASRVSADSPADAAMLVVTAVRDRWHKGRGGLKMRTWTAHRERALLGGRSRGSSGSGGAWFDDGGFEEGGSAGVREPRRPLPGPGTLHAEADLPGPQV